MRDKDVRLAIHGHLRDCHAGYMSQTRFLDELGLCGGQVRVDVAVVNGALSGYELKSASDTLRRLPAQVDMYSRVLDFATLVVADNHLAHARKAVPRWWGLIVATTAAGGVELDELRPAKMNDQLDPMSLAQLLWREEALDELDLRGAARGVKSKPRWAVWQRLVQTIDTDELRAIVRCRLKERPHWRDDS